MDINTLDVLAEVTAVFERYEDALVTNKVDVLDELFWHSDMTVRYGAAENLVGIDAIRAFRLSRPSVGLSRQLMRQICEAERKNRCSGVKPSITLPALACGVFMKAA